MELRGILIHFDAIRKGIEDGAVEYKAPNIRARKSPKEIANRFYQIYKDFINDAKQILNSEYINDLYMMAIGVMNFLLYYSVKELIKPTAYLFAYVVQLESEQVRIEFE